jgi:serine/threonine-protein kinase ULK/ATG1
MIGHGANTAAIALARATNRPQFRPRTSSGRRGSGTAEVDPAEEELLKAVEDLARKAFALFELGDVRLGNWNTLAQGRRDVTGLSRDPSQAQTQAQGSSSPFADNPIRRKSSSSSTNSEVLRLREQELAAGEACVLYCKALGFIVKGTNMIQRYWEERAGVVGEAGVELNESKSYAQVKD